MKNYKVSHSTTIELDVEVEGTAIPYRPAVMYLRNGDPGSPSEGGYCEDIGVFINIQKYSHEQKKKVTERIDITHLLDDLVLENLANELWEENSHCEQDAKDAADEARADELRERDL